MSANVEPTIFTDDDFNKLEELIEKGILPEYLGLEDDPYKISIMPLISRLKAAERVCNEATGVAYNLATTIGTKTNETMPKWFLARIEELDNALKNWWKISGRAG
jgi:hypothetical protein